MVFTPKELSTQKVSQAIVKGDDSVTQKYGIGGKTDKTIFKFWFLEFADFSGLQVILAAVPFVGVSTYTPNSGVAAAAWHK